MANRRSLLLLIFCLLMVAGTIAASLRNRSSSLTPANPHSSDGKQAQKPGIAPAAVGPIERSTLAGGGGSSTGAGFRVDGTIGEVAASNAQTGGSFTLAGGFWNFETVTPSPTPTPTPTPTATPTPPPNILQFSQTNYGVQEDCTTLTITVNRIGDVSGPATVDYSTADGSASDRNDYITALGALQFAAVETSKSFVVLINEDSYVEGNENFSIQLANPSGASLGGPAIATVQITDDPVEPAANTIDDPQSFVCQHYHDFLNRQPDGPGLAFWTNQITSCGSDLQCVEVRRISVSASFFLSIEFQETGYLVERMYKAAYGDATGSSFAGGTHPLPVPAVRYSEFLFDTQRIGRGVVVLAPGWDQLLESNKQAYAFEFAQRARFSTALPTSLTPMQFVNQLFANAGVTPSDTDRNSAISEFGAAANTTDIAARARALRRVAQNAILNQQEVNRAFVLMQYLGTCGGIPTIRRTLITPVLNSGSTN